ncbi:MAG TPA: class I SAM-dependent methyltransferase [Solirubrobacteraceae bacterium]|jgi:ubiquinone/menaquinone biosynthesis C-methylase UbiE|nr:class I SAM-dependent methyltransferase [Solirubrobacteraceae bacterium]
MFPASRDWDARVGDAELIARSPGFRHLRDRIIEIAGPSSEHTVVDLGAGTGLLTLAFAERAARVWAVDSSPSMIEYLRVKARSAELENVETVLASAVSLPLVDGFADLVVSNYCLHELRSSDKDRALGEAMRVLKPGGRLVIGDMMFSLNPMQSRDRSVVAGKLRQLASRGLPGAWRLLKNAARLAAGRWEYPANGEWWDEALQRAGFHGVSIEMLPHEGGIAVAETPPSGIGRTRLRPAAPERTRHSALSA